MTDWRARLREADPARDQGIAADDVERVRRTVMAGVQQTAPAVGPVWRRPLVVAAAVLITLAAGAETVRQRAVDRKAAHASAQAQVDSATAAAGASGEKVEQQQLHFSTPGGTRIIWVFDSSFEVKGTKQ
jgi:hypothetical protein